MKNTDTAKCLKILQRVGMYGIHSFHLNQEIGTTRCAARIQDLKDLGYEIESVKEKLGDSWGCRYTLRSSTNVTPQISKKPVKEKPVYQFDPVRQVYVQI